MSLTMTRIDPPSAAAPPRRRLVERAAAPVLGVIAAGVALIGAPTPSFWGDEAATVMSAQRSLPSLLLELSHVDAVHGLYYVLMHFWIGAFGASELSVRVPSVIAAGFAVAGTVLLGRVLFSLRVGVVAGIVLAALPQFTRYAIEARSYELELALATWLTLLLVAIVRRRGAPRWMRVLYVVGMVVAIWMWVFMAMLVGIHAALLAALRPSRAVWRRWAVGMGAAAVACLPIAAIAFAQRGQIAFLSARAYATPVNVLVTQWFGDVVVAAIAWALLLAAAVAVIRMPRHRRRRALAMAVWAFGPTALILAVNAAIVPVYNQRYLIFSMPAVAIGIAIGATAIGGWLTSDRRRAALVDGVLIAALVAATIPSFVTERGPYGKTGADLRQVAEILQAHARPGDAVVYDQTTKASRRPRTIEHLYPADVAGLDDVALTTPDTERAAIWDDVLPVSELGSRLSGHRVVWAVEVKGSGSPDLAELQRLGYAIAAHYAAHRTVAYQLVKQSQLVKETP